jgi:DNA-binding PadR family transcriptional regulator
LLGLIIERPEHGYGLAKRFEDEFGDALPLGNSSRVYDGLDALEAAGLIEEAGASGGSRRPRPKYKATPLGVQGYVQWLRAQIRVERLHARLFPRQLAALESEPMLALQLVDEYERAWLADEPGLLANLSGPQCDALVKALPAERARLAAQAELPWASYARARFTKLAEDRR